MQELELEQQQADCTAVAVAHPVRGGSQAHVMQASDGHQYVVKAVNNPQGRAVLACEYIGSRIMAELGLSVPPVVLIDVPEAVAAETTLHIGGHLQPYFPGLCVGSRCPAADTPIYEFLPDGAMDIVANRREFAGAMVADKWTCNCDSRQVIFHRDGKNRMVARFVDQGFCFNAGDPFKPFPDSHLRGIYTRSAVYKHVQDWADFEPWLSRAEHFDPERIRAIVERVPDSWVHWQGDIKRWKQEISAGLIQRRSEIRRLIHEVSRSPYAPFTIPQPDPERWEKARTLAACAGQEQPQLFPEP